MTRSYFDVTKDTPRDGGEALLFLAYLIRGEKTRLAFARSHRSVERVASHEHYIRQMETAEAIFRKLEDRSVEDSLNRRLERLESIAGVS